MCSSRFSGTSSCLPFWQLSSDCCCANGRECSVHQLEGMRLYEDDLRLKRCVFEVNEDGSPTDLARVDTYPHVMLEATMGVFPQYRCECGEEFISWHEAKGHII